MSDDFGDWPSAEEQRRNRELFEMRRLRRAQENLARELRLARTRPVRRGLTVAAIRRAAADVRARRDGTPTRDDVAEVLGTSVPTLARAMKELGMEGWPPAPPED